MRAPRRLFPFVLAVSLAAGLVAAPVSRADDGPSWTSLYASGPYAGAGWTRCPDPIRISVDTRQLKPKAVAKATRALRIALAAWNRRNLVRFEYAGQVPVRFDRATGVSTPEDGVARDRWIYITLVRARASNGPDAQVVGLAGPLRLDPSGRTIVEASAAFQAQYVNTESLNEVALLFAHELGHVGGLGHSTSKADIMWPILSGQTVLGPGDIEGMLALLKECPTEPPAAG